MDEFADMEPRPGEAMGMYDDGERSMEVEGHPVMPERTTGLTGADLDAIADRAFRDGWYAADEAWEGFADKQVNQANRSGAQREAIVESRAYQAGREAMRVEMDSAAKGNLDHIPWNLDKVRESIEESRLSKANKAYAMERLRQAERYLNSFLETVRPNE